MQGRQVIIIGYAFRPTHQEV